MIRESYWKSYLESICYCRPQFLPHSLKVWDHGLSLHSSSFACLAAKLLQLHATLWDPMDCSLPGSSAHGILQARTLEWVAVPSTRGASWPSGQSHVSCIAGGFFTVEPAGGEAWGLRWFQVSVEDPNHTPVLQQGSNLVVCKSIILLRLTAPLGMLWMLSPTEFLWLWNTKFRPHPSWTHLPVLSGNKVDDLPPLCKLRSDGNTHTCEATEAIIS